MAKPKPRRLVDMSTPVDPPPQRYHEPPPEECEEFLEPIRPARGHLLTVKRVFRTGQNVIVYFSVNQSFKVGRSYVDIGRIDSEHGEVHRHQFFEAGGQERTVLEVIHPVGGEERVDQWADRAEKIMQNEWESNFRRWRGDGE